MNQSDIEAMIQRYTDAEMAVLDGKSVTFNGQQMTMENLNSISNLSLHRCCRIWQKSWLRQP